MWKTGHSLIKAKMKETGALLAGEMSGHIFFKERWYGFDDGLYAGARLLEILSRAAGPDAVLERCPMRSTRRSCTSSCAEGEHYALIEKLQETARFPGARARSSRIDGLRVEYADGFGLARPSNTTPVIVLRFEADDDAALKRIQDDFRRGADGREARHRAAVLTGAGGRRAAIARPCDRTFAVTGNFGRDTPRAEFISPRRDIMRTKCRRLDGVTPPATGYVDGQNPPCGHPPQPPRRKHEVGPAQPCPNRLRGARVRARPPSGEQFINVLTRHAAALDRWAWRWAASSAVRRDTKTSVQSTKASVETLNLLQAGRGEIAFTLGDSLSDAWKGRRGSGLQHAAEEAVGVAAIYPNYIQIVARADAWHQDHRGPEGEEDFGPKSGTELSACATSRRRRYLLQRLLQGRVPAVRRSRWN